MNLFNKILTTTALAAVMIASAPFAHARETTPIEPSEDLKGKVVTIKIKIDPDKVESSFVDRKTAQTSSLPTQEEWNPTEEELNRILEAADAKDEDQEAKKTSSSLPTVEEGLVSILNSISQNLPKAAEILQNNEKEEADKKLTSLGQTLVEENKETLGTVFGSPIVNDLFYKLNNHSRRTDEKTTNKRLFGMNKKNHYVAVAALDNPNSGFIPLAVNNPEAWDVLATKWVRFPILKEIMEKAKVEAQSKK